MGRAKAMAWGVTWGYLSLILSILMGISLMFTVVMFSQAIHDVSLSSIFSAVISLIVFLALSIAAILTVKRLKKEVIKNIEHKNDRVITLSIIMLPLILVMILGIVYFWRPNTPDMREHCITSQGFQCLGKPVTDNTTMMFGIRNDLGYDAVVSSNNPDFSEDFKKFRCSGVYLCSLDDLTCSDTHYALEHNSSVIVIIRGCDFGKEKAIYGNIEIFYTIPESNQEKNLTVELLGFNR